MELSHADQFLEVAIRDPRPVTSQFCIGMFAVNGTTSRAAGAVKPSAPAPPALQQE